MLIHPAVASLWHDVSRTDLFLTVFCLVDDWMHTRFGSSNQPRKRRGPRADEFADSEVLTLLLVGELCRVRRERAWLRQVRANYRTLFPALPEDSRFCRRAQAVRELLRHFRASILHRAGEDVQPLRLLDSFPMPLCACYRMAQSTQTISGSSLGYNSSKKVYYFGLHPGLLLTEHGYSDDLFLGPGYLQDVPLLTAYLDECIDAERDVSQQAWIMDKGFINQALQQAAKQILLELFVKALKRLRAYGQVASAVQITVKYRRINDAPRTRAFPGKEGVWIRASRKHLHANDEQTWLKAVRPMIEAIPDLSPAAELSFVSITFSGLLKTEDVTLSLFEEDGEAEKLAQIVDAINKRSQGSIKLAGLPTQMEVPCRIAFGAPDLH